MDQRRLRPGDTIEDYCTRERRLTDHVVVAVVDDVVKQTRCSACDTEHPFKEGRVPPRRKKPDLTATLRPRPAEETEAEVPEPPQENEPHPNLVMRPERKPAKGRRGGPAPVAGAAGPATPAQPAAPAPPLQASAPEPEPEPDDREPPASSEDDGPVHRRLIRATLPRPEGQVPARPNPEFTIRQPGARGTPRAPQHFGKGAGKRAASPWDRTNGSRPGAHSHSHGQAPHGRDKGRSHGPRHHKKTR